MINANYEVTLEKKQLDKQSLDTLTAPKHNCGL